MAVDYTVNYDDERFQTVEADKKTAMDEVEKTYDGMIDSTDGYYQQQIDATEEWGKTQQQLQQEQTDFTIEKIEQDKAQAQKDYTKEQSAAYADWQKQSNKYGVQAEQQAAAGLYGGGYSESSQVAMYNTYQNRVATARESYQKAVLNYENSIKEARLQNNSILAEIAFNTLQTTLQLGLEGFQYKNQLITDKMNQKIALDQTYWSRQQDILNQINTENALAEQVRQYDTTFAEQKRQYEQNYQLQIKEFNEQVRQFEQSYKLQVKEYEEGIRQFNEEIDELKKQNAAENAHKIKQLELQKQQLAEEKRQADLDYKIKQAQLAEEKRQFDETNKGKTDSGGGGGGVSGGGGGVVKDDDYIETDYYKGKINPDAKTYGTFSNGYQPKGIKGYGAVKDSGDTILLDTVDLSGQKRKLTQTLWETPDGSLWYWEGRENKYKLVKENTAAKTSMSTVGSGNWWHKAVK